MDINSVFPRLLFLSAHHDLGSIPKVIAKALPQGELLACVMKLGLGGASAELGIPLHQLNNLYYKGQEGGPGSPEELRSMITQLAIVELETAREDHRTTDYLKMLRTITDFGMASLSTIVDTEETSLSNPDMGADIDKWQSGFQPLDLVTGGLYQGVITLIGKPGSGKTSIMLALMTALRATGVSDEAWFFETEIPLSMMMYKMRHARHVAKFGPKDRMVCGLVTMSDILARVEEDPNPNRVVFIDSPDVMAGGDADGKRYALESIYRDLIRLKGKCKLVVVASQARRADNQISQESVAESFTKAWYSDMLVGIKRGTPLPGSKTNVTINVPKNRFGTPDQILNFRFDYVTLQSEVAESVLDDHESHNDW